MNPVPEPVFLNVEYLFYVIYRAVVRIFSVNWLEVMYVSISLVSIGLIFVILYALVRLYEMKKEDKEKEKKEAAAGLGAPAGITMGVASATTGAASSSVDTFTGGDLPGAAPVAIPPNATWNSIRERLLSDSPSDWRLAIIEADIYLDRQLDAKGWHGDTIGDKLKQLTPVELPSIQIAWEAHKVRNRIAHDLDYVLTTPEARRTLSYYEIVFRDLHLIP